MWPLKGQMHASLLINRNGALISNHGCFLSRENLFDLVFVIPAHAGI